MNEAALPFPLHLLFLFRHELFFFLLVLFQGQSSWAAPRDGENPMQVEPKWPVVPAGGSIQLRCSMACPGNEAAVQWKGLDTSLSNTVSEPGLSILTIHKATLSMAGTRVCIGTCQGQTYQERVELLVYTFPDKVEVSPSTLVLGQAATLACSAQEVFPYEGYLTFSWYRGDKKLGGLKFLHDDVKNEQEAETGEYPEVFSVTKYWALPADLVTLGPELRCLVEMKLEHQVLNHSRGIAVWPRMTSPEPSTPLATKTPEGLLLPSSEAPRVQDYTSTLPDTTASSLTLGPGSSLSPTSKPSTGSLCLPEISWSQTSGVNGSHLMLRCKTVCEGASVSWSQAPGSLADYQRQEAGAQATLIIMHPGPQNRGLYQCQQEPGGQTARISLDKNIVPDVDKWGNSAALWTGGCLLGLILMAFFSYRLWRWLRTKDCASLQT
ncbi:mucosal addressin cell adhesion molecule 1 [Gracilinanus agilis]|uniref:mucosal addressin cell adhesion molecule 1 n=1 Tax=Gracilinanus agilis TaxID=191870 RepID=UPI001CFF46E8|nr:mucosal addressin cell adhesion molecule 1 [Gracilinanus agilis]